MLNKIQRILHRYNLMWDYPTKSFQTKAGRNWLEKLSLPEIDRFELDLLLEEWRSIEEQIKQVDAKIVERASRSEPGKALNATQVLMTAPVIRPPNEPRAVSESATQCLTQKKRVVE